MNGVRTPISVLLVDADQRAREGLRRGCDEHWLLEVVGEAGCVVEATAELDRLSPDVLVTDVRLTDGDGLTLARRARAADPDLMIVVLTANASNDALPATPLDAGVFPFLGKDEAAEKIAALAWQAVVVRRIFPIRAPVDVVERHLQPLRSRRLTPRE